MVLKYYIITILTFPVCAFSLSLYDYFINTSDTQAIYDIFFHTKN